MNFAKFYDEMFKAEVYFFFGCNHNQMIRFLVKHGFKNPEGFKQVKKKEVAGQVFVADKASNGNRSFIVWVRRKTDQVTMVHEALHLVKFIFQWRKVKFTMTNDEMIAIYQEYWIRHFLQAMRSKKTKVKLTYKERIKDFVDFCKKELPIDFFAKTL